ncbi:hypothetical protein MTBUT4_280028 [Magnetospirillum sp. UT-4]|nr:hypothetical protein MTBUT4_280028 [Magnetospirillum sp. UT-4]
MAAGIFRGGRKRLITPGRHRLNGAPRVVPQPRNIVLTAPGKPRISTVLTSAAGRGRGAEVGRVAEW